MNTNGQPIRYAFTLFLKQHKNMKWHTFSGFRRSLSTVQRPICWYPAPKMEPSNASICERTKRSILSARIRKRFATWNLVHNIRTCLLPFRKTEPFSCGIWSDRTSVSCSSRPIVGPFIRVIGIRHSHGWPLEVATDKLRYIYQGFLGEFYFIVRFQYCYIFKIKTLKRI